MTDEQSILIYEKMLEMWPQLPSAEHEPKQFEFYMKMFQYCHPEEVNKILGRPNEVPQEAS